MSASRDPINSGTGDNANYGWFLDEGRPTLTISSPRPNRNDKPLDEIRVGVTDAYTGVNHGTLSINADFAINGRLAGMELAGEGSFTASGIFSIPLKASISNLAAGRVTATVADRQGNTNVVKVRFWVDTGFRIMSWDASQLANRRITIRIENSTAAASHTVLATDDLAKPLSQWTRLNILNGADEANRLRRLEVELPNTTARSQFLRVQQE